MSKLTRQTVEVKEQLGEALGLDTPTYGMPFPQLIGHVQAMRMERDRLLEGDIGKVLTGVQHEVAGVYRDLARELGIDPESVTAPELIRAARVNMEKLEQAMRKQQRLSSEVDRLREELSEAQTSLGYGEIAKDQLREKIAFLEANAGIDRDNLQSIAEMGERREQEVREQFELQAAENLVRALTAEKTVRELQECIEELNCVREDEQARAWRALRMYDELTLALEHKWGREKQSTFLTKVHGEDYWTDEVRSKAIAAERARIRRGNELNG